MKTKTLIPIPELPNLYVVKVELTADDFNVIENNLLYDPNPNNMNIIYKTSIIGFDFEILGYVTKDEISFDASELVESTEIDVEQYDGIMVALPRYKDYEEDKFHLFTSDESFRSALDKNKIFFINHLKFPSTIDHEFYDEPYDGTGFYQELYSSAMDRWQTAEDNLAQKLVVLIKK